MLYEDAVYRISGGHWRGRNGHVVHLLTWVTDDLLRQMGGQIEGGDLTLARLVAEKLGVHPGDVGSDAS
jgi:hypothetical protein